MDYTVEREDMTEIMDYSINDVVCLMKCEEAMGYIDDQIIN